MAVRARLTAWKSSWRTLTMLVPARVTPSPKFPPSRWANVFAQLVAPLMTEITCLRSHGLRLFHLVSAHVGSLSGGTTA
jgi:hypothetical protein